MIYIHHIILSSDAVPRNMTSGSLGGPQRAGIIPTKTAMPEGPKRNARPRAWRDWHDCVRPTLQRLSAVPHHVWLCLTLRKGRLGLFGHVSRLPRTVPANQILRICTKTRDGERSSQEWRRACGRPAMTWIHQICRNTGVTVTEARSWPWTERFGDDYDG